MTPISRFVLLMVLVQSANAAPRADITDRHGVVLATTTSVDSIFADPQAIRDVSATAAALSGVLPGSDSEVLRLKLAAPKRFVWIARHVDAATAAAVTKLSLPGIGRRAEYQRVYSQGALTSHVVGIADYDAHQGVSGAESVFDAQLSGSAQPVALSIDVRAQAIVRNALQEAITCFEAKGAAGLLLDAQSGEIVAFVSLPDFLPADRNTIAPAGYRNKLTDEVHELGGFFEVFTTAIALEDHRVTPAMLLDVTRPMRLHATVLRDDEPAQRPLSVADVFARSSVIGAAMISERYSPQDQMTSLRRLGVFDSAPIDGRQAVAQPLYHPNLLRNDERTAIGYGYGIAMAPLQAAVLATAIMNHGLLAAPTLLRREANAPIPQMRVVTERTSSDMRSLMRHVVSDGTGVSANVAGMDVGGKTGTSFKLAAGEYDKQRRMTWFFGGFPMSAPRYALLVMLDEPQGIASTGGKATAQWNAVPTSGRIVSELAPVLGIKPGKDSQSL
jgi:cell division protein FtsI (penicillin-binding protein 3)